jgi:hypothetical protein
MSKKKARKPQQPSQPERQSQHRRKITVVVGLLLSLGLSGLALAQWSGARVSGGVTAMLSPSAPLPTPTPTPQLTKEYIYASGKLVAIEEPGGSSSPTIENVFWANVNGVTPSGNSLSKPGTTGWNAGAVSSRTLSQSDCTPQCYAEFTATETNTYRMFGLANGDTNQSDSDIEFAFEINPSGQINVWEGGQSLGLKGSYTAGDHLRVSMQGTTVHYLKNGTDIYSHSVTPNYPLLVDTSLYSTNSTITNAVIASYVQTAPAAVNVVWSSLSTGTSAASALGNTLTKTGSTYAWDSGGVSTQAIASGDGYLEFTAGNTNTARMCGLNHDNANYGYGDIDYAIFLGEDGVVYLYEAGVYRNSFGSYSATDVFRVSIEGGVVKYRKNGNLFYTSTITPTYPLAADTSLNFPYAVISDAKLSGTLTP